MNETIPYLPGLSPVGGKELCARFDGGRLSSDGGVLLLREIERRLGIAEVLGCRVTDGRLSETGDDLMSQPTLSRLENAPSWRELGRMGLSLIDLFCESRPRPLNQAAGAAGSTPNVNLQPL